MAKTLSEVAAEAILTKVESEEDDPKTPKVIENSEEPDEGSEEEDLGDAEDETDEDDDLGSEDDDFEDEAGGEEEEGSDDDDERDPDAELYEVTVDDEVYRVTLEELKQSYSGEKAIAARVQEASENAKASYKALQDVHQAGKTYLDKINTVAAIQQSLMGEEPDWAKLQKENPELYNQERSKWDMFERQQKALKGEFDETSEDLKKQQAVALQNYMVEQYNEVVAAIPELGDPQKAKAIYRDWAETAGSFGFTQEELNGLSDNRMVRLLHDYSRLVKADKARQARIAKRKEEKRGGKLRKVRSGIRPNSSSPSSRKTTGQKRREQINRRARQTGNVDDVAKTLLVPSKS